MVFMVLQNWYIKNLEKYNILKNIKSYFNFAGSLICLLIIINYSIDDIYIFF